MEIYGFYTSATMISDYFGITTPISKIWSIVIAVAVWLALFILQGVGLCAMAKGRGIQKRWLAFCPFVNLFFMGKLAGECNVFGQRVKRAGLYTMIAQIVVTLLCGMVIASEIYLYNVCGEPVKVPLADNPLYYVYDWENLTGFSATVEKFYEISDYFIVLVQLVYEILLVILLIGLYKKYAPKNITGLGILSLLIPSARYIVVFALRKRKAIDYEAYMRARREEYMRRSQQYGGYGNPYGGYGSPYGRPYSNPYGNPYAPPQQPQDAHQPDDPFEEFSSDKKGNAGDTAGADEDEFFN